MRQQFDVTPEFERCPITSSVVLETSNMDHVPLDRSAEGKKHLLVFRTGREVGLSSPQIEGSLHAILTPREAAMGRVDRRLLRDAYEHARPNDRKCGSSYHPT